MRNRCLHVSRQNWKTFVNCLIFICFCRYQQNSRDGEKLTGDGQQSVPLCSTSDVQLRFLCPDDLDEVLNLIYMDSNWHDNNSKNNYEYYYYLPGTNIVPRLVSNWLSIDVVSRHYIKYTILCTGGCVQFNDNWSDSGRNKTILSAQ